MLSKIITGSINGIDVEKVVVETDFSQGLPYLTLVGLPDMMVRESKERIRSAIINSGFVFPMKRITVNLSPADTRKSGSHFDLPMAVGILTSSSNFDIRNIQKSAFLGELSLDGTVNPIEGCLALILGLKENGISIVYVPEGNREEALSVEDMTIYAVDSLVRLMDHLSGVENLKPIDSKKGLSLSATHEEGYSLDYADIIGQESAKRAMQVCATGWHDIMMTGPPGIGKTMLASRLNTILPKPSKSELDEITKIHSIAGELHAIDNTVKRRPFRAPHHTSTAASLMGGGCNPRPGELSLAHRGVLFLDELPEFEKKVLDMLRQPLEDGFINLSRVTGRHTYPCQFILVSAMNPCPCGHYNNPQGTCTCNTAMRVRYENKVSGPLRDRIDIHLPMHQVDFKNTIQGKKKNLTSDTLKAEVSEAALIQQRRYKNENFAYNSQIPDSSLGKYCKMNFGASSLLNHAAVSFKLSSRAVTKIKRLSRSIADLEKAPDILEHHVAEAIGYRSNQPNEDYCN